MNVDPANLIDDIPDPNEFEVGNNPFKKDIDSEFIAGYIWGDAKMDEPKHGNIAYLSGAVISSVTPLFEWVATIRDFIADLLLGKWFDAAMNAISGIISAMPESVVLDELPGIAQKIKIFLEYNPEKVTEVGKWIVGAFPVGSIKILDDMYAGAVKILQEIYGFSDELIKKYADEGIDLSKVKNGLEELVTQHTQQGSRLSQKTADQIGKFDEPIKDIRFAGKDGPGADIVATTVDGRIIEREVTTFQRDATTYQKLRDNLKDVIYEEQQQFSSQAVKEIHIQMNSVSPIIDKANLDKALKELADTPDFMNANKIIIYNSEGFLVTFRSG